MSDIVEPAKLTRKDFASNQEVRWCPGCGDYSILANVQRVMPELGVPRENIVWVSGIGCSSRFPYYMNTYGFHTIHGRGPAFVTGIKAANPDLSVWLATGDGDGLSIGGNQLMHCLRRNIDVNILLFNNRIYGLTKGQYSPTSEVGKITKSTPLGSADYPLDPAVFAIGASASFVARAIDTDAKQLAKVIVEAAAHTGGSFIEIYQNCPVFNDNAFESFTAKSAKADNTIVVEHGQPLIFGAERSRGLRVDPRSMALEVVTLGENGVTEDDILLHDKTSAALAYMLARMPYPEFPVALGVLYQQPRPTYETRLLEQTDTAKQRLGQGNLDALLRSGETWTV